jgi:MoaA/NifB/PqqE/SkfB family radical SAM enzyme
MASIPDKLALLRGLLEGQTAYRGPFFVGVDVTRRCNTICLGCAYHCKVSGHPVTGDRTLQEMPLDLARSLAGDLAQLHVQEVVMAGEGEPLLHSRFIDVVTAFKEAGLRVQVFTNGILLDDNLARRIVAAGLDRLNVSFWAVTPEEHAKWHPGLSVEALDQRTRGVAAVRLAKQEARASLPRLTLQMPIHRENLGSLSDRVDLALKTGCDAVGFGYYRHHESPFEGLALRPEDADVTSRELGLASARLRSAGIHHNAGVLLERVRLGLSWLRVRCYAPWFSARVRVDGRVQPCPSCDFAMGTVGEQAFAEIWHGPLYRDFRRRCSTRTPDAGLGCDCRNCCMVANNGAIQRVFRWFEPFARRRFSSIHVV